MSDWIQTYTGRQFWPLEPRAEDVAIEDIAHSLSLICRYNGHCRKFYSVAEHSMRVAEFIGRTPIGQYDVKLRLAALLHDASEVYLSDIPKPLKPYLTGYKEAEARVQEVIHEALGLGHPLEYHHLIKPIDTRILVDEVNVLMPMESVTWHKHLGPPLGVEIVGLAPDEAESQFLECLRALSGEL